jgi:hypothetical protein
MRSRPSCVRPGPQSKKDRHFDLRSSARPVTVAAPSCADLSIKHCIDDSCFLHLQKICRKNCRIG